MYAVDMLGELGLPEDLIDEVRGMLAARAEDLEGSRPSPIGDVFGGSEQGAQLTHHAAIARQHVADAVLQMAAGLRGYRDELGNHVTRMDETDTRNGLDLKRLESSTSCVAPADFRSNAACAAPSDASNEEGR